MLSIAMFSTSRTLIRLGLLAGFLALAAPPLALAASPAAERLFAKYHWRIDRSGADGAASAFVLCQPGKMKLRVRPVGPSAAHGRLAYLMLFVNGKFVTRIDRRGAIGLADGEGIDGDAGTPWVEVAGGDRVRKGMNRVTLVYRGRMGPGDKEEPGPGVWQGEVNLAGCRLYDMLRVLKGLSQATGWEAEVYRTLEAFDGALRAADRDTSLEGLHRAMGDNSARAHELLVDPETRRFYAEVDDCHYSRHGARIDLGAIWKARLATFDRLEAFWGKSRLFQAAGLLYREATGIVERLDDVARARENLRNLYAAFAVREPEAFGADHFDAALGICRQNLEVLDDLLDGIAMARQGVRQATVRAGSRGRPPGSEDIRGPFEVLAAGSRAKPVEFADVGKLAAAERELNLYLTLIEEHVRQDQRFLRLELALLADLIGRPPPEPARNRRVFTPRPKWAK